MDISDLYQKGPCKDCPFRKDSMKGRLGEDRMKQILSGNSFTCHKTKKAKQCGGFMIIKGKESAFVNEAEKMNIELGMVGKDKIFSSKKDCIKHHKI